MFDREIQLKLILLGTINTGKSSLIERFKYGYDAIISNLQSTIGIDYCVLNRFIESEHMTTKYNIYIWDAGGHDSFINIVRSFLNRVTGTIVLYDISSLDSFHKAKNYIEEYKKYNDYYSYILLVGNKIDLDKRTITKEEGQEYANSLNIPFCECSVKNNINVEKILDILLKKINDDINNNILIPSCDNNVKIHHRLNSKNSNSSIITLTKNEGNCCNIM